MSRHFEEEPICPTCRRLVGPVNDGRCPESNNEQCYAVAQAVDLYRRRLREVTEALDGHAVMFDKPGERIKHLLTELDQWIERAGKAERRLAEIQKGTA
jgi:hypothetical protein